METATSQESVFSHVRALDMHDRLFSEQGGDEEEEEINIETAPSENNQALTFITPVVTTHISTKQFEGARARSRSVPHARSGAHAEAPRSVQPSTSSKVGQDIDASTSQTSTPQATLKDGIPTDPKVLGIRLYANELKRFHNNNRKTKGDEINKGNIKYTFSNPDYHSPEKE